MSQLFIIPCGKKKIWDKYEHAGPVAAKRAYIGTFHRLCENYAKQFGDRWVTLSAKYGYLDPEDIVEANYDLTFGDKTNGVITPARLKEQVLEKRLDRYIEVIVLTGKKYKPIVFGSFPDTQTITFPLLDCSGIGMMQQRLKRAVQDNLPIH
ncbi:DUF6884 domain-containing protein [Sediminibacillus massiliensis]|uniref:DUF6884 domain-containing protein n=1 Tax=Sediminibacillus massiliensis TaxID=1926277 RepID=UPI0009888E09|nr:DUF6884 domain-containing protein [Sediminibacillus massiliensis]